MITEITIENYQAHKNSKLSFTEGVNVIIGSSRSGKSAILRALNCLINNKNTSEGFIRHGETRFKITADFNGNKIIREKGKNGDNIYMVNDQLLKAFGQSVPDEVQAVTNFDDLNFQKQFDKHFLISETSGEVARVLNRIIKLDSIDNTLMKIESRRRSVTKIIDQNQKDIETLNLDKEKYNWIEKAENILFKIEILTKERTEVETNRLAIEELIDDFEHIQKEITNELRVVQYKKEVENVEKLMNDYSIKKDETESMRHVMYNYECIIKMLEPLNDLDDKNKAITDLTEVFKKWVEVGYIYEGMDDLLLDYKTFTTELKAVKEAIVDNQKKLNDVLKDGIICPIHDRLCKEGKLVG